jgi:hypothetical protein
VTGTLRQLASKVMASATIAQHMAVSSGVERSVHGGSGEAHRKRIAPWLEGVQLIVPAPHFRKLIERDCCVFEFVSDGHQLPSSSR